MGRDVPQDHENKDSRLFAIFLINGTQLKYKNHLLLRPQVSTVCMLQVSTVCTVSVTLFPNWFKHPCSSTGFFLRVKLWKLLMECKFFLEGSQEI